MRQGMRPRFLTEDQLEHADWCFEVVFDYGEHDPDVPPPDDKKGRAWPCRPDPFSTYRPGFEVRTYRLCRRVLMFHHFLGEPGVGVTAWCAPPISATPPHLSHRSWCR